MHLPVFRIGLNEDYIVSTCIILWHKWNVNFFTYKRKLFGAKWNGNWCNENRWLRLRTLMSYLDNNCSRCILHSFAATMDNWFIMTYIFTSVNAFFKFNKISRIHVTSWWYAEFPAPSNYFNLSFDVNAKRCFYYYLNQSI